MERIAFNTLPQTPKARLDDSEVAEFLPAQQSRHRQRGHVTRPNDTQKDMQQPHISARVSQRQFHENILLLHHKYDAQDDHLPQRLANELQRRTEARDSRPLPLHPQQRGDNGKTLSQVLTNTVTPESTEPGPVSTTVSQELGGQSYVEKRREEQQVHTRTHPGDIDTLLQRKASRGSQRGKKPLFNGRGHSDQPYRKRDSIRRILARRRKLKAAPGTISLFGMHDEQSLAAPVNWPFGCKATSGLYRDSGRSQHHALTQRETGLLLRNPLIRDGNMGPLPIPDGVIPPQPPPHVYGKETGRVSCLQVPRLPGLKRRNAQRRSPNPALQEDFESFNDRFYARFRRGSAAKDVHIDYASPVELSRRRSILPQIQEASNESSDSEPDQQEREETGACPKDESNQHAPPITGEQVTWSEQSPQHQIPATKMHKAPCLRRFPLVIRGPRPAPGSPSTSSSKPTAPPSSASLTSATQPSTPAPETELQPNPEPENPTQDESGCGTPGCTLAKCSHIRGTLRMPFPGAAGESRSEGGGRSTAETRSEDDVMSVGNGFSFLRLN